MARSHSTEGISLADLVTDFAAGLTAADALSPQAVGFRSGKLYQAGIGPHGENAAVMLIVQQMLLKEPERYAAAGPVPYPRSRLKCDLGIGNPLRWAIEVKMARAYGDNGKLDDTYLKDLLSPYERDRSAFADAMKLARSEFNCRKAILIYGFDYPERSLDPALHALQLLVQEVVKIGDQQTRAYENLIHPVHRAGRVTAWEVLSPRRHAP
jgi:hypothetical protein